NKPARTVARGPARRCGAGLQRPRPPDRGGRARPRPAWRRAKTEKVARGRWRRTPRPRETSSRGTCSARRRASWCSLGYLLLVDRCQDLSDLYGLALPWSFWILTRGSPGQGVLNTACEPPLDLGEPK